MPPGQLFSDIAKKSKTINLRQFNIFLDDFGLFPGVFDSRDEVKLLFHKLNLMSKRNESRVELSLAQFDTFIQGVLELKMPKHHRGMSSEEALHGWRQRKISGDHSNWIGLQTLQEEPMDLMEESKTKLKHSYQMKPCRSAHHRVVAAVEEEEDESAHGEEHDEVVDPETVRVLKQKRRNSLASVTQVSRFNAAFSPSLLCR